MTLDFSAAESGIKEVYTSFEDYVKALYAVVTEKLPDMLKEAETLTDKAERAKEQAEPEFESLGGMKVQAGLSFV